MWFKEEKPEFDYEKLESKIKWLVNVINDIVICEVCGCLLFKDMAIKGKAEIKQKDESLRDRDYIYYPYYCKVHAPKGEKE